MGCGVVCDRGKAKEGSSDALIRLVGIVLAFLFRNKTFHAARINCDKGAIAAQYVTRSLLLLYQLTKNRLVVGLSLA